MAQSSRERPHLKVASIQVESFRIGGPGSLGPLHKDLPRLRGGLAEDQTLRSDARRSLRHQYATLKLELCACPSMPELSFVAAIFPVCFFAQEAAI
eukprot:scaffold424140_cov21-Prasinocladus_malaysianus.AAC.1